MALIVLGLVSLGVFAWLSEAARRGSAKSRVLAAWEAGALTGLALLGLWVSLYLLALRCNESCGGDQSVGGGWNDTSGAWQWWGQFTVASLGFAAIVMALVQTVRRRHRSAATWMVLASISFGAWTTFLAPLGNRFGL